MLLLRTYLAASFVGDANGRPCGLNNIFYIEDMNNKCRIEIDQTTLYFTQIN